MKKEHKSIYIYYQYSTIGFQMVIVMAICMWLGLQADRYFALRLPIFLSIFSLLSTILCTYGIIRKLLHQNKQQ